MVVFDFLSQDGRRGLLKIGGIARVQARRRRQLHPSVAMSSRRLSRAHIAAKELICDLEGRLLDEVQVNLLLRPYVVRGVAEAGVLLASYLPN